MTRHPHPHPPAAPLPATYEMDLALLHLHARVTAALPDGQVKRAMLMEIGEMILEIREVRRAAAMRERLLEVLEEVLEGGAGY